MRRLIGTSLLLVGVITLPGILVGQAPANKNTPNGPTVDSDKLHPGQFTGTIKSIPGTDRTFTVTIPSKNLAPNGKAPNTSRQSAQLMRLQSQLQTEMNRLAGARTPQQRNQISGQISRTQNQIANEIAQIQRIAGAVGPDGAPAGYKWVYSSNDVDFQTTEEVKVRTTVLPEEFDEKGNPKKYTKKELDELKGKDKNLPGYESAVEKLAVGQSVVLTLVVHKHKKPSTSLVSDKDKDKEKDAADKEKEKKDAADKEKDTPDSAKPKDTPKEDSDEKKLQVKMIVITAEPTSTTSPGGRGKKN
jgi:hypothetical protein